jgi:AraC-like DNA-binding protein
MSHPMKETTGRPGVGCMSALTDALGASGADDVAAVLVTASDPWGFGLDAARSVAVIAVIDVWCWLRQPAAPPIGVSAGELALVPRVRSGHGLASTPETDLGRPDGLTGATTVVDVAGDGSRTSLICVTTDPASAVGRLLASRPAVVVRAGTHQQRGMLDATLRLLAAELAHDHPGARTAAHRLVEVLVLQLLRAWIAKDQPDGIRWHPTASADETVAAALELIHTEPARRWTIGVLAAQVGLSRAAFVRRFTTSVGQPPSTYLARWRLATAARRLRDSNESLVAIARAVGYSSEFTFSRAFNRAYGQRPGRYRAAARRWAGD